MENIFSDRGEKRAFKATKLRKSSGLTEMYAALIKYGKS